MAYRYGSKYDERKAARRGQRWQIGFAVAAVVIPIVVGVALVNRQINGGFGVGKVDGSVRWELAAVSPDARTLTLVYSSLCPDRAGAPLLQESGSAVEITIPRIKGPGVDCVASYSVDEVRAALAAPLGARTLRAAPGASGLPPTLRAPSLLGRDECADLRRLPAIAPARDVPWVQRQLADCR